MVVDGDAADVGALVIECEAELFASGVEDVERDVHDFGADAITGENCKFQCFHRFREKRSNLDLER